ncbi:MAG TPA: ABC transporter permease [Candidatus Angelobacter sp.]|jgi:putative ABC transport system permease protein
MSLFSRITSLFRSRKIDQDLEDELRSHLEMRAEDNASAGMSLRESHLNARRRFGNTALIQENARGTHIFVWLESVVQDIRYGLRTLRRSPVFTIVAIVTMVLSIGATTAIFTLVESILLRPLPYPHANQLVTIATFMPRQNAEITASPEFLAWRERSSTLEGAAAYDVENFNFSGAGEPDRLLGVYTTADFFSVLGIAPQLGRTFSTEEDQPGAGHVVVLSHRLWQDRFGMAGDVVGKKIMLEGEPYVIVGVMPENFRFPDATQQPDIMVPLALPHFSPSEKTPMAIVSVVGRMKPGISLAKAGADLTNVSKQLVASYTAGAQTFFSGSSVRVRSLQTELVGSVQRGLLVVLVAVGFVLLIGCLNVASLQLARAVQRGPEVGVRSALGAGKARLVRQLLTENLVLSFCGGCGGLAVAFLVVKLVRVAKLHALPSVADIHVDARVLTLTLLVTIICGFFFGLAPALWALRSAPADALAGSTRTVAGTRHRSLRNLMVVLELSVALVLLAGAGLLVHSFVRLMSVDSGFNLHGVLTARINLLQSSYPRPEQKFAFIDQLTERLRAIPGVESVAAGSSLPLMGWTGGMSVNFEGRPAPSVGLAPMSSTVDVDTQYFRTLQIPLLVGRNFTDADNASAPNVALVNQTFARKYFPDESAVGKRFHSPIPNSPSVTIVGVVGDEHHLGPEKAAESEIYFPMRQNKVYQDGLYFAVRTRDLSGAAATFRNAVKELDRNQPVFDIISMEEHLSESLATRRLNMLLLGSFALLALTLAAVGTFGVLSYSVAQRSHEIGIRMALGSGRRRVIQLIMREAILLSFSGAALGLASALVLTRFMSSLLYNTHAADPLTMLLVSILLIVVGAVAGFLPAHRASKVDPMIALRAE